MLVEQSDPDRRTMSAYQPDTEAGRHSPEAPPSFRMVPRGHDRDEVDACFSQLAERPQEAVDQYARAEQAKAEPQGEVPASGSGRRRSSRLDNGRRRAQTITEKAGELRADVTNEAQKVLEQAWEVAEQIHQEVEQEWPAVLREIHQVREFWDGLLDDLGGSAARSAACSGRTAKQRDQALAADGAAEPQAAVSGDEGPEEAEPAKRE